MLGVGKSMIFLKRLESEWDLEAPLKVQVRTLRLKLCLLTAFFCFQSKWQIHVPNLKVLLNRIRAMVRDADKDLQPLWSDLEQISSNEERRIPVNYGCLVSRVLQSIKLIKPDIQEVYSIISKSSRSATIIVTDEEVMELIYSLLEGMEDLFRFEIDSIAPVRKEMEVVEVSLRFLRGFFGFAARGCSKGQNIKALRTDVAVLAHNMACLLCLCVVSSKMDDPAAHEMKLKFLCQLQKVKPIQAEVRTIYDKALNDLKLLARQDTPRMDKLVMGFLDSLLGNMKELSETKLISTMISVKDRVLALEEELRFFTHFVIDRSPKKNSKLDRKINYLVRRIILLICDAGRVVYSFYCGRINGNMAMRLSSTVADLLGKVKVAKEDTRKIYLPVSLRANFPRTNEMGFVCFLLQNLKETLKSKDDFFAPLKHHIEEVQEGLVSLQEHFSGAGKHLSKHKELKDQLTHFKDVAYLTEYVIDSFVIRDYPLWCYKLGLSYVIEEIKMIATKHEGFQKKLTVDNFVLEISGLPSKVHPVQADPSKIDMSVSDKDVGAGEKKQCIAEVVVFEDEAEKIKEQLTNGLPQLHILSIVGMPGVGKTTLADSIFENPSIKYSFHVRARCCVSQVYQKRRLLLEILQQITRQTEGYMKMIEDEDLDKKVYQSLKGKRYLILLDDIWDIGPWNDIQSSFPDDNKKSRIIFTSRFRSLTSQVESKCITYPLYPLSDEKSWEMLQIKLFQKQSCPGELVKIGQQIAKNCKGLPLAVDLVAGILRMREQKASIWQQVARSLKTELLDNPQGRCKNILEMIYHHLPDHLKPCFLYFGAFPEDLEIPTRKLISMWIAEGFVQLQNAGQRSLEYVAETYLSDLISRSLITISKRKSLGGVKASRVHDLLGEFARVKAKEDCFYLQMDRSSISCHGLHEPYRLNMHGFPYFWQLNPSGARVRSLLFYGNQVNASFPSEDIFNKFRVLRVLDLMGIRIDNIPDVVPLVHLRFLALCSDNMLIITKIVSLQSLETFLLDTSKYRLLYAEKLCQMKRLRHFHISEPFSLGLMRIENLGRLDNLQTLSTAYLEYNGKTEEIMRQFPNLEELKCKFSNWWVCTQNSICFPKLGFLSRLKSLNMSNYCTSRVPYPCEFSFPSYLKKLTLSNFSWPWCEISIIGKLGHLEVLKLGFKAFVGKIWKMRDGEFPRLKFLSLCELDIEEWNASEDHLPCLERLKVLHCWKLKELPSCLATIATLMSIETKWCNPSAKKSAKSIKEEQRQLGNYELEVNIH